MVATQSPIDARKRPRQARSAATVEAIVEAAARVLEAGGLAAFNTNAVAEKAGVSVGSLYQYFPAKEALLAELIRRKRAELMTMIEREKAQARGRDLPSVLNGFIRAAVSHQLERPRLAGSLEYAEAMLPIDTETEALKRMIVAAVAEILSLHGIAKPETAARDLAALTRGMVDAAGLFGETDMSSLEPRVRRAVYGYLGIRK
ncbi:putative transcriptional regulator, TetR family protein [Mesorhizobium sp. L-8-10]|nr:TetR/AcrR family transcriptional regulator [Mesorhizobium sp. L-8-3]BCH26168.1 putative transcriptional regulator, TetR family protein [Mesorhizobium sp. L-8-3]BCH34153.1 putative transcriptional regulator, TetR family protein [Mesorhizobium sp. L-8-10]